jgi:hypothetical protein
MAMISKPTRPNIQPVIDTWAPSSCDRIFDAMAEAVSNLINSQPRSPTKAEIVATLKAVARRSRFQ